VSEQSDEIERGAGRRATAEPSIVAPVDAVKGI